MVKLTKTTIIAIATYLTIPLSAQSQECDLRVGVVPQFEQRKIVAVWTPLLSELSRLTGCMYTLVGSKDIPSFERKFRDGVFDLVYLNPYHSVIANREQGYVQIVRSDSKMLQGILTVRKDAKIDSLEDLQGQEVAFPSPNALGASLLMRTEMEMLHGIRVVPKYVSTHGSVYLHVFKKLAMAGGGVERTLSQQDPRMIDAIKIIYKTQKVNAHPIAIHPRVGVERQQIIQLAFLRISRDSPELLSAVPMKMAVAASSEDYQNLATLGLEKFAEN